MPKGSNDSWGTPARILNDARWVMGGIDIDPASNALAQEYVQAGVYFDADDDGLAQPWPGKVWLNGPYSDLLPWAHKLAEEIEAGHTVEFLALTNCDPSTRWWASLLESTDLLCLPRQRVSFIDHDLDIPVLGNNKPQAIFYGHARAGSAMGARGRQRFLERFSAYGPVFRCLR